MHHPGPRRQKGFGFVELMISNVVVAIATALLISHLAIHYYTVRAQRDRAFAYSAAESIQSEIQALTAEATGSGSGSSAIDRLDDGESTVPTLSIAERAGTLVAPDHEISANYQNDGHWVWTRHIDVEPLPSLENRKLRYVTVRIFRVDSDGIQQELASVSSVVSTLVYASPPTQVFDLYLIAIENIPGTWMHAEALRPFVMRSIREIEQNNPGLQFRTHWITKASYGRDPVYRPYVNERRDSLKNIPEVYYYPGLMPPGSPSVYHYVPSLIGGRINTDAGEQNGYDQVTNPYPYALADYFNHAMRYPREKALHEARTEAIRARKEEMRKAIADLKPVPAELAEMSEEPTLRLLLEDLATDPQKYRNALVMNLHGELLPMPSLRNYSDAAKDPATLPGLRVVSHPEELRTQRPPSDAETDVRLRVYAYLSDPDAHPGPQIMPETRPIGIQVMGLDLTDGRGGLAAGVEVANLRGGVTVGGTDLYFPMSPAKMLGDSSIVGGEMFYDVEFVDPGHGEDKYTLFKLYNTPVTAPPILDEEVGTRGLAAKRSARLYGLEYIPTCTGENLDFSHDLYSPGDGPKNTARWVLTVPGEVFENRRWVSDDSPPTYLNPNSTDDPDRLLTFRTRIWDPELSEATESGTSPGGDRADWIQPYNLSETYTWWTGSAGAVPFTERAQFQGDPRHNPYRDLLRGSPDFPDGYNRYFDSLTNGGEDAISGFPGIDPALQGNPWQGSIQQDAPRYFELLRNALVRSETFSTAMTGAAGSYLGQGNDIGGYTRNGYAGGIPMDQRPFGEPGKSGLVDQLAGPRHFVRSTDTAYWWGIPWLGELFPDPVYDSQWFDPGADGKPRGNLDAGSAAGHFYQWPTNEVHAGAPNRAHGTAMLASRQVAGPAGSATLFNVGSSAGAFHHLVTAAQSTLADGGLELTRNYATGIENEMLADLPFDLSSGGAVGEHFDDPPYSESRYEANLVRQFFRAAGGATASGIVEWIDRQRGKAGYFVATGIENNDAAAREITELNALGMIHAYLESGEPGRAYPNHRLPRVVIQYPTESVELSDPDKIDIRFDIDWTRWDGRRYVDGTAADFAGDTGQVEYSLMYSKDSGETWSYALDDSPAMPGRRPEPAYRMSDRVTGPETASWLTSPLEFPGGSYLLRIEAYLEGQSLHYAFHEKLIRIDR